MMSARVRAAMLILASYVVPGCGGGATSEDDGNGGPANDATTAPAAERETGAAGCVAASCPALQLFGSEAAGCCQASGDCGGNVMYRGVLFCAPPDIEQLAAQVAAPIEQLDEEEIVPSEACPGTTFQGAEVAGCCDQTGVCGVSTEAFAANSNRSLPFDIPVTCISEAEAQALGMAPARAEASAPIACSASN